VLTKRNPLVRGDYFEYEMIEKEKPDLTMPDLAFRFED
jgi:hypothetical protein